MTDQPRYPNTCYRISQLQAGPQIPWAHRSTGKQQPILDVVQQPGRTRVTRSGRPKSKIRQCRKIPSLTDVVSVRFNLDPPPILRLRYVSVQEGPAANRALEHANEEFKLNPRLFVLATLVRSEEGARPRDIIKDGRLLGSTVASPHMLRNDIEAVPCNLDLEGKLPSRCELPSLLTIVKRRPSICLW